MRRALLLFAAVIRDRCGYDEAGGREVAPAPPCPTPPRGGLAAGAKIL